MTRSKIITGTGAALLLAVCASAQQGSFIKKKPAPPSQAKTVPTKPTTSPSSRSGPVPTPMATTSHRKNSPAARTSAAKTASPLDLIEAYQAAYAGNPWSRERTYSKRLMNLIRRAAQAGEPLDYDPLCGCQDTEGMPYTFALLDQSPTRARAQVTLNHASKIVLVLVREASGWRVDDVLADNPPSLAASLGGLASSRPAPPPVDHFPEQLLEAVSCRASLGTLLANRSPSVTTTSNVGPGNGYVYRFPIPIVSGGWRIIGLFVDPFHFRPGVELHAYVIAPETELLSLANAAPALPRKKGALKWYEGRVSLYDYDIPRYMGIPLNIPERDLHTNKLPSWERQISGLTMYGNGFSVVRCYNPDR